MNVCNHVVLAPPDSAVTLAVLLSQVGTFAGAGSPGCGDLRPPLAEFAKLDEKCGTGERYYLM